MITLIEDHRTGQTVKLIYGYGTPQQGVYLYCGDCRVDDAVESILGETRADLVLADPPYGQTSLEWDRWPEGWLLAMTRVLKPEGSLWCHGSFKTFIEHQQEFAATGLRFVQDVVWNKGVQTGSIIDRFGRSHELITQWIKTGAEWKSVYHEVPRVTHTGPNKGTVRRKAKTPHHGAVKEHVWKDDGTRLMLSVMNVKNLRCEKAGHATPKPVELLEPLIRYSCPPGGLVVVPFSGSGSEMEACVRTGRRVLAFEADEKSCVVAAKRLEQLHGQQSSPRV